MPRTAAEIAALLDRAHESLMMMARSTTNDHPDAKAEFYAEDGSAFTLEELAADLRDEAG